MKNKISNTPLLNELWEKFAQENEAKPLSDQAPPSLAKYDLLINFQESVAALQEDFANIVPSSPEFALYADEITEGFEKLKLDGSENPEILGRKVKSYALLQQAAVSAGELNSEPGNAKLAYVVSENLADFNKEISGAKDRSSNPIVQVVQAFAGNQPILDVALNNVQQLMNSSADAQEQQNWQSALNVVSTMAQRAQEEGNNKLFDAQTFDPKVLNSNEMKAMLTALQNLSKDPKTDKIPTPQSIQNLKNGFDVIDAVSASYLSQELVDQQLVNGYDNSKRNSREIVDPLPALQKSLVKIADSMPAEFKGIYDDVLDVTQRLNPQKMQELNYRQNLYKTIGSAASEMVKLTLPEGAEFYGKTVNHQQAATEIKKLVGDFKQKDAEYGVVRIEVNFNRDKIYKELDAISSKYDTAIDKAAIESGHTQVFNLLAEKTRNIQEFLFNKVGDKAVPKNFGDVGLATLQTALLSATPSQCLFPEKEKFRGPSLFTTSDFYSTAIKEFNCLREKPVNAEKEITNITASLGNLGNSSIVKGEKGLRQAVMAADENFLSIVTNAPGAANKADDKVLPASENSKKDFFTIALEKLQPLVKAIQGLVKQLTSLFSDKSNNREELSTDRFEKPEEPKIIGKWTERVVKDSAKSHESGGPKIEA